MRNTIIIVLREIDKNEYINLNDKRKLMTALLLEQEDKLNSDLLALASIYRMHEQTIKRYRVNCTDKLKYKILTQSIGLVDKMPIDKLRRFIHEIFEYMEYGRKHIKTKYNASYYALYNSQIIEYDSDKTRLVDIQSKRRKARAKVSDRPKAYTLLAKDKRIKSFDRNKIDSTYLRDANIRFAKFWSICPLRKVNKPSCKKLFIADHSINWDNNSYQKMLDMFLVDKDKFKDKLIGLSTFDFLLDIKICHANLQYIQTSDDKLRAELAERWIDRKKSDKTLNYFGKK